MTRSRDDEHLAVAHLAGARGAGDGPEGGSNVVRHRRLDLELGQEVDDVLGAAVQPVWPFCRPKPLTSVTVSPVTPPFAERFAHLVELERPDDGDDQSCSAPVAGGGRSRTISRAHQHGVVEAVDVGVAPFQPMRTRFRRTCRQRPSSSRVVELAAVAAHPLPAVATPTLHRRRTPSRRRDPARCCRRSRGCRTGRWYRNTWR